MYWTRGDDRSTSVHCVLLLDKAIPVTDLGGPYGCETSRLPHFLHNQLTDDSEVVSLTHQAVPYLQGDS
jgi:hypothetical protein